MNEAEKEARAMIRKWIAIQKERYGEDWKAKLSDEMTKKTMPFVNFLFTGIVKK